VTAGRSLRFRIVPATGVPGIPAPRSAGASTSDGERRLVSAESDLAAWLGATVRPAYLRFGGELLGLEALRIGP
jgi:hypothetical protein